MARDKQQACPALLFGIVASPRAVSGLMEGKIGELKATGVFEGPSSPIRPPKGRSPLQPRNMPHQNLSFSKLDSVDSDIPIGFQS